MVKNFKDPFDNPDKMIVASQEAHTEVSATKEDLHLGELARSLEDKYEEKRKKPTVNDTHIRTTVLLRKDLRKRVDRLARGKNGFKTMFYNEAVEIMLKAYEDKN